MIASLVKTCKLNGVNPQSQPVDLLPWAYALQLPEAMA